MKTELEQKLNAHIRLAAENMLEGELDGNLMSRYLYGGMEDVLKLLLPHLKAAGLLPANYTVPSSRDVRLFQSVARRSTDKGNITQDNGKSNETKSKIH